MKLTEAQRRDAKAVRTLHIFLAAVALVLVIGAFTGCASLSSGLNTVQAGMAGVDTGLDALTEVYKQAADLCSRNDDLPACDRLGDREDVLRKAEFLSAAYDETAEGLAKMEAAANEIAPHFEAARDVVRDAGLFSR